MHELLNLLSELRLNLNAYPLTLKVDAFGHVETGKCPRDKSSSIL